jgi:DNA-binding transcriptional MerR regulator
VIDLALVTTPSPTDELTIDELSARTHVPSRTIRFYQARGALMPPTIVGRVAHYGAAHEKRLELIAQLQDKGLRIDAIRDLCAAIDRGDVDIGEWLGVEVELAASWSNDQSRTVTGAELQELAGSQRPGLLADLCRAKIAERKGDVFFVASPALLTIAMRLEAAGVDLETSAELASRLRKHLSRAVEDIVNAFVARAHAGEVDARDPKKVFQALRPASIEAVRVIFGREMERQMRKLLESGKLATLPAKARKARKR